MIRRCKIEGGRISFTLTHERTYTNSSRTFYPTFRCTGTVHGDDLDLTLVATNPGWVKYLEMQGVRVHE
jgi:hypothetical protein